jgi:pyruvate/2-oxoglutarate dehydrogenase complex dihydrolipoamide dehydrogenase (E3) component
MASILPNDDPEAVDVVRRHLVEEGVDLLEGVKVVGSEKTLEGVAVKVETGTGAEIISGSHLLIVAGRRPHLNNLDLEKAGIEFTAQGINVDARLRTTNK